MEEMSMRIQINDKWQIRSEENNITLYKSYQSKKAGCIKWRNFGYFNTVTQALNRLIDESCYASGATSIEELKKELEELKQNTLSACCQVLCLKNRTHTSEKSL